MFKFGQKTNKKVEELVKLLPEKGRVLDLGCGMGANSGFLANQGFDVIAVDKDKENIEHIKNNYPKINAINKDILEFNFSKDKYDLILALNVLSFFDAENAKLIIKNIIGSLKENGLVYLQVFSKKDPNKKYPHLFDKKELKQFFSKNKILELKEFSKKEDHPPTGKHEHWIIRGLIKK